MTSPSHQSGTDRLAEVAAALDCDLIVNVQGDEPLIEPETIDAAVAPLLADPALEMSTLRRRIADAAELAEPERHQGRRRSGRLRAVFLARADSLHACRAAGRRRRGRTSASTSTAARRLLRLAALPPTAMERAEALEQLRALEHGIRIKVVETDSRLDRRRHARRPRARPRAARAPPSPLERPITMQHSPSNAARQIHPRHRRRRLVARQGPRRRVDRRAARGARLQGRAPEVRPLHQRRSRAR